jgi:hypothetical protein
MIGARTTTTVLAGAMPGSRNARATTQQYTHKTTHNSTNIDLIQKAIKDIKSRENSEHFTYTEVAKKYSVN